MAKTSLRQTIPSLFNNETKNGIIEVSKIDVPHTTITNRAQIIDLANDMSVNFGINRIMTQKLLRAEQEGTPDGKKVYKVMNDKFDQIRFVGDVDDDVKFGGADYGPMITMTVNTSFIEVTFYGTGLNILAGVSDNTRGFNVAVDGGGPTFVSTGQNSGILTNRKYNMNTVFNLVSGLSLGIHTVRLSAAGGGSQFVTGFEFINESTQLEVNAGSSYVNDLKIDHIAESIDYSSGFTNEYGTAGTRGGNVLVYHSEDGTVKKDIQYTDTASQFLGATDHSNEEVIRRFNFREFGSSRSDDFSTQSGFNTNTAFTLDDGTTALVGSNEEIAFAGSFPDGIRLGTSGGFIMVTFVGTGLDIDYLWDSTGAGATDTCNVRVDGVLVGSLDTGRAIESLEEHKICSGLPYGTHTVQIDLSVLGTRRLNLNNFTVYGPKKPALPSNSTELASYYLMADYVTGTNGNGNVSTGVIRKDSTREFSYSGAWDTELNPTTHQYIGGIQNWTATGSDFVEYTFFGTGFELRHKAFSTYSSDMLFTLNGTALTAANFPTATFNEYGYDTGYNSGTGSLDMRSAANNVGAGFGVSNLPLGIYTVRITNNAGGSTMGVEAIDIITPIHYPKNNGPFTTMNTLAVGSTAIKDSRVFEEEVIKIGKTAVFSGAISDFGNFTAATFPGQAVGIGATIHLEKRSKLQINMNIQKSSGGTGATMQTSLMVNGHVVIEYSPAERDTPESPINASGVIELDAGYHQISIHCRTLSGSAAIFGNNRSNLNIVVID